MAALQINPAVREEIVTVGSGGKAQLDEGAFAENFVEFNHLTCYNNMQSDKGSAARLIDEFESRFQHNHRYDRNGKGRNTL